uniref:Uncharacterized protein n=1 Tax=Rhizophora mucronata TaxID=61149 RepID=A0A2P2PGY1_RHIMU
MSLLLQLFYVFFCFFFCFIFTKSAKKCITRIFGK